MFDLSPDDELALVLETARRLAQDELVPAMRDHEADRAVSSSLAQSWAEVGLSTLDVPEALDGAGLGCLARVHVNEALAEGDVGATVALDPYGPALVALHEVGGEDAARALVETTRNGARRALYLDERDAQVRLEGASRARARARLHTASLLLGVLSATCTFSAAYAQERQAFGKPIGHHQALAFLITDMRMALEAARLVVHEAAWRVDRNLPCVTEAASAWAECIEIARTIGPDGVQILGGHGFMADYPVEKHMREARALSLLHGGFDAAIEDAGLALVERETPLGLGEEGAL